MSREITSWFFFIRFTRLLSRPLCCESRLKYSSWRSSKDIDSKAGILEKRIGFFPCERGGSASGILTLVKTSVVFSTGVFPVPVISTSSSFVPEFCPGDCSAGTGSTRTGERVGEAGGVGSLTASSKMGSVVCTTVGEGTEARVCFTGGVGEPGSSSSTAVALQRNS